MTSCFIGFQNFPGENPQPPPPPTSRLENMWFIFQSKTAHTQAFSSKWGFQTSALKNKSNILLVCDEWAIVLFAKDLLHHLYTIIYHYMDFKDWDPINLLENLTLICSLFLLEFQWNNLYFA